MKFTAKVILLALIAVFSGKAICAQELGNLYLEVLDPKAEVVPNGLVRLLTTDGKVLVSKSIETERLTTFREIQVGDILIEVTVPGFETLLKKFELEKGENPLTISLKIKKVEVEVTIEQSKIDRRLSEAFGGRLSRSEIDSLPEEPQDIAKELKKRYGNDLLIRVNGFLGGRIPPKKAIQSIHVSRSSFDAEYHELGNPSLNIVTKTSVSQFFGLLSVNYENSLFNARNAFEVKKLPHRNSSVSGFFTGPAGKGSSFSFSFYRFFRLQKPNIIALRSKKPINVAAESGTEARSISGEFQTNLGSKHGLRFVFGNDVNNRNNAGIGRFNLAEYGFGYRSNENKVAISSSGVFSNGFSSQFRSKISFNGEKTISNSTGFGIVVADTFNAGGRGYDNESNTDAVEVFETISTGIGRHFIKVGGELHLEARHLKSLDGSNGRFFFTSLQNYLRKEPSSFSVTRGCVDLAFIRSEMALFVQDDFRILKRLQLGVGLRYERQNHISDDNNFSPRLSAAVVLDEKARLVLRSGVGILYERFDSAKIKRVLLNDGKQRKHFIINNPRFPSVTGAGFFCKYTVKRL